jgi:hypothetical protein
MVNIATVLIVVKPMATTRGENTTKGMITKGMNLTTIVTDLNGRRDMKNLDRAEKITIYETNMIGKMTTMILKSGREIKLEQLSVLLQLLLALALARSIIKLRSMMMARMIKILVMNLDDEETDDANIVMTKALWTWPGGILRNDISPRMTMMMQKIALNRKRTNQLTWLVATPKRSPALEMLTTMVNNPENIAGIRTSRQ